MGWNGIRATIPLVALANIVAQYCVSKEKTKNCFHEHYPKYSVVDSLTSSAPGIIYIQFGSSLQLIQLQAHACSMVAPLNASSA